MDLLLEKILLEAELLELEADPDPSRERSCDPVDSRQRARCGRNGAGTERDIIGWPRFVAGTSSGKSAYHDRRAWKQN